jgi:oxygen-independent coproporphyrinogen III oxidase
MSENQETNAAEVETTVGNYFVANYPPFSFWNPGHVEGALQALDQPPAPDTPLGVYLHIPFCRKRCHFCYFRVYTDRNSDQIKSYLDSLVAEMRLYANKAFIGGRKPQFVYFGGGTPSYLAAKQLKYLAASLSDVLDWSEAEEITFECEPGTLNETKLKTIRDLGVTRLSLGVENFKDEILALNNRAHLSGEVYTAYEAAKKLDFPQINIDLIAGMLGETEENWQDCIEKTLELDPDSVTIYQMEIPYNTKIYKDMKEDGKLTAPVADWPTKRRWVKEAFAKLSDNGYRVGSAYTAVKKSGKETRFLYRDALWHGADLIPLGVSSFGHISGYHLQNQHDSDPYESVVANGELPLFRGYTIPKNERLIREFILQLKIGRLNIKPFQEKFGVDVRQHFADPLKKIADQGFLGIEGDDIVLSEDGMLRVDSFLDEFFLPEHRNARYV